VKVRIAGLPTGLRLGPGLVVGGNPYHIRIAHRIRIRIRISEQSSAGQTLPHQDCPP